MSSSKEQGPHWPRVVHTARTPDPHGVHPPLLQGVGKVGGWLSDL